MAPRRLILFFVNILERISVALRVTDIRIPVIRFSELLSSRSMDTPVFVDAETAFCRRELLSTDRRKQKNASGNKYTPIHYSLWDKIDESDRLLVAFCALSISETTGTWPPPDGKIIVGNNGHTKSVKVADHLPKVLQIIEEISKEHNVEESFPIRKKHCQVCDYESRCRSTALAREDLSLLESMSKKEQGKCKEKGITTITQLSYGYRPRRKRRVRSTASRNIPSLKHDHKLKALAIKKAQIHVVGTPELSIDGSPVYLDVEGVPDSGFYYLIGLRYMKDGRIIEQSLWANTPDEEQRIWEEFLAIMRGIDNPRLVHYGAYENRFLRLMRERWKLSNEDADFVGRIVDGSVNLLATIYGKIYFPTYSNGLKEIARWIGFEWSLPRISGWASILLRHCWELTADNSLRDQLIVYNLEDCRAAELVADAILAIGANSEQCRRPRLNAVNVSSLEVGFQRSFGKFRGMLSEFDKINAAAYWNYQRSKVYVRTDKKVRQSVRKAEKQIGDSTVEKVITITDRPRVCSKCGHGKFWNFRRKSQVIFDLRFTHQGLRRWIARYNYDSFRCANCKAETTLYTAKNLKYGPALRAYIVYLLIEMRLSNRQVCKHLTTVFNIHVGYMAHNIKCQMAKEYEPTYQAILRQIASGSIVHADETKGVVYGGGHYVWVFANMTSVAYVYSKSRESTILEEILSGFNGVLISDFYGGYESMSCPQQKCLIHLMRDINEDMFKHPFNDELTFIARRFGELLREIVETVDRYGLKKFHLGKHKRSAERFLDDISKLHCVTETGTALRKRIEKNRDKLFTFLDYDGVPWNNNNAEHAVRAFTCLRNGMPTSTPKGTREYCILLSLQQTLHCRGIRFLDFLRSGKKEIDD